MDWQSPVALAIVALTAAAVVARLIRRRRTPGCGGSCCPHPRPKHHDPK